MLSIVLSIYPVFAETPVDSDHTVLTESIVVEQLSTEPISLNFSEYSQIDPKAALALSKWTGTELILDGLTSIDTASLELLVQWKPPHSSFFITPSVLSLNGLKSLSAEEAKLLSNWAGSQIYLDGLTEIQSKTLRKLNNWQPESCLRLFQIDCGLLRLNGVQELNFWQAYMVSNWDYGDVLSLNGIKELNFWNSFALKRWNGQELYLNGVHELSFGEAQQLGRWSGKALHLDGIDELNPKTAQALSKFPTIPIGLQILHRIFPFKFINSELYLNGLKTLDAETAKGIFSYKGDVLHLNGIEHLSSDVVPQMQSIEGEVFLRGIDFNAKAPKELKQYCLLDKSQFILLWEYLPYEACEYLYLDVVE